jgi:ABC-type polysaccharide/polyol phosphate export permease
LASNALASAHAANGLRRALGLWRLWLFLGWQDIKQRYRGSIIGPFWVAGSVAALGLGAGALYAVILKQPAGTYIPYLTIGVVVWTLISGAIGEACQAFIGAGGVIRNTPLPPAIHVFRVVWRNLIVAAHNLVVAAVIFAFFRHPISPMAPLALLGVVLLCLNLLWISWVAAAICARFRDMPHAITYTLQIGMFLTPLFWLPEMAADRHIVLAANPLWHLLEIVRAPILGMPILPINWIAATTMAVLGLAAVYVLERRYRHKIIHWL